MPDLARILDLLERDGALELGDTRVEDARGRPVWPEVGEDEAISEVDHGRLFPRHRPSDRGQQDFEVFGDDWEFDEDRTAEILEQGPRAVERRLSPEWDVWAWYQPIHFFGSQWGIFIREAGLIECSRRISALLPVGQGLGYGPPLAKAVLRASFATLFLHEAYHHKTESLALRMHIVERRPIYPPYHRLVYRRTAGTNDQIEEGLANADSWNRIIRDPYAQWTGRTVTRSTRDYLEQSFQTAPSGYSNAARLLRESNFDTEQEILFSQVQEGVSPTRTTTSDFSIATHLNQSLFNVSQRIWTVVPAGARSILPTHPAVAPLATSRLERFITKEGWREVPGGKGSHRKFRDATGRMIILPASKDVSLTVLKSTAKTLGMDVRALIYLA